ncbi:MAG TPA: DUF308 domain-containing protein [Ignavibacteriaceae bacterium]|nr:DUF308 domain-containing protein [Ignavibacteriaceae bacterium]
MNSEKFSEQNKFVKHWNLNLISGIIYILVSMWVFAQPEITFVSLAMVFSITLLFTGALGIISSIRYKNLLHGWSWSLAAGILNLLVVIKAILKPQISTEALILIMGFVFLYHSVKLITWSTELKNYEARNLGWVLFGSFAGVMLSFLLIWNRTFPQMTPLFFISFALLMIGISEIYFSFVLRNLIHSRLAAGV